MPEIEPLSQKQAVGSQTGSWVRNRQMGQKQAVGSEAGSWVRNRQLGQKQAVYDWLLRFVMRQPPALPVSTAMKTT